MNNIANLDFSTAVANIKRDASLIKNVSKIVALQDNDSNAMLISIGPDGKLYLIKEHKSGAGKKEQWDLWHINPKSAKVIDFSIATDEESRLDFVIAAEVNGEHKLYVSSNNNINSHDFNNLQWNLIPYDDTKSEGSKVPHKIKRVDIELYNGKPFISIFTNHLNTLFRYYIDDSNQQKWQPSPFGADVTGLKNIVMGKPGDHRAKVPGIYTISSDNKSRVMFSPMYNYPDKSMTPNNRIFSLDDDDSIEISSIAGVNEAGKGTNLFAIGTYPNSPTGKVFCFPYNEQRKKGDDFPSGTLLFDDELFKDADDIEVVLENDTYILWGRNGKGDIFYTTCKKNEYDNSNKWSKPIIIKKYIKRLSSFYNRKTHEISFFGLKVSGDVIHSVRCPKTSIWIHNPVHLPKADAQTIIKDLQGHKTTLFATDEDGKKKSDYTVSIKADSPVRVFVNKVYYRIEADNYTQLETNEDGAIEIEEISNNIHGTAFHVKHGEGKSAEQIHINPGHNLVGKINTIKDGKDLSAHGLGGNATDSEKDDSAELLKKAGDHYMDNLKGKPKPSVSGKRLQGTLQASEGKTYSVSFSRSANGLLLQQDIVLGSWLDDAWNSAAHFVGDVCSHIEDAFEEVEHFAMKVIDNVVNMAVKIAGNVYRFVLDTAKAIGSAIQSVLQAIGNLIKKLFDWLLSISKGVRGYLYSIGELPSDALPQLTIGTESITASNLEFKGLPKDITVANMIGGKNHIQLKTGNSTKTGTVEPFTGMIFSSDFGRMFSTDTVYHNGYVYSYGFYRAGHSFSDSKVPSGQKMITDKHQVYLYAGKNQTNWMRDIISKYPNAQIKDLVFPGSHDAGMCVDIPLRTNLAIREEMEVVLIAAGVLATAAITATIGPFAVGFIPLAEALAPLIINPKIISRDLGVTQKESITSQLNLGIRHFDFRPGKCPLNGGTAEVQAILIEIDKLIVQQAKKRSFDFDFDKIASSIGQHIDDSFPICHVHGIAPGIEFDSFLTEIIDFLENHRDEIVVVGICNNGIGLVNPLQKLLSTSHEKVDQMVQKALTDKNSDIQHLNIISDKEKDKFQMNQDFKCWSEFSSQEIKKDLINKNKRLIFDYEGNYPSSYGDNSNCKLDVQKMQSEISKTLSGQNNKKDKDNSFLPLSCQGTIQDPILNSIKDYWKDLVFDLAIQSEAGDLMLSTKGWIDKEIYPYLYDKLVKNPDPNALDKTILISNDFVDIGLVSIAVEATKKKLSLKG